jgi:hypothetical protein
VTKYALVALLAFAHVSSGQQTITSSGPLTRAERTNYQETSHYADVIAFLDTLRGRIDPSIHAEWGTLGYTSEQRAIPYVILSRAHGKRVPVVYVQANIHAGEVEGKEALLALLRDLGTRRDASVLDSIVLIAVPIYNADGNEKFKPQSVNRTEQNGPEMVGQRPNGMGLDLNRDYVKAEAPETRASLAAFNRFNPDVFVDLHTTDGSFHGYALTYSPSLSPAALKAGAYTRDSLLPELRRRVAQRDGFAIFDYGNFEGTPRAWKTYDNRPRFGTNYFGIRGKISILSEAYSHDPFERRVKATYAFVREILSLVAERRATIAHLPAPTADSVPIRAQLTTAPLTLPVVAESLIATGDSSLTQPGVPKGYRRAGKFDTVTMAVYDRFEPTLQVPVPPGYVVPAAETLAVRLLRLHGIEMTGPRATCARAQSFAVDSSWTDSVAFQGHRQAHLTGHWQTDAQSVHGPCYEVSTHQRLGVLAVYLLEPESDDGLVTWNVFPTTFPVRRLAP